jgi:hypothetical protein
MARLLPVHFEDSSHCFQHALRYLKALLSTEWLGLERLLRIRYTGIFQSVTSSFRFFRICSSTVFISLLISRRAVASFS